jgi:hypothetical protein
VRHAGGHDLQAGGFKARVDLADHVFCHCVGLDDGEGAFDCHESSLTGIFWIFKLFKN